MDQKKLISQSKVATKILSCKNQIFLDLKDNELDGYTLLTIVKKIENVILSIKPQIIFTHFSGDLNIDHQITNKAVMTASRPYPNQSIKKILTFEVQSSTDWQQPSSNNNFAPNCYIDISGYLTKKLQALEAYSLEMRPWPHRRSNKALKHLAYLRGPTVGFKAAEAFQLIRELKK